MPGENIPRSSNDNEKPKVWTQNDAVGQLGVWRREVNETHRFDVEPNDLTQLIIGVINGKIDPTEAIKKGHAMMMGRQEGLDGISQ